MTEKQNKFIELDKKRDEVKKFFEEYNKAADELFDEISEGGHFQDEEGTVYMAERPNGTFVEYRSKGIVRTRRINEQKGTLSMKKAEELGYTLK